MNRELPPIANMVRVMLERDASRDEIVTAIAAFEHHADRHVTSRDAREKAAVRARRYRENKRCDASRDAKSASILTTLSTEVSNKKEERKHRTRKANAVTLRDDWQPNENHRAAAQRLNITEPRMIEIAEDMRLWAKAKGALKVDWDATFHVFMRKDRNDRSNRETDRDKHSISRAAGRLAGSGIDFGPRPSILPLETCGDIVRLLPERRSG